MLTGDRAAIHPFQRVDHLACRERPLGIDRDHIDPVPQALIVEAVIGRQEFLWPLAFSQLQRIDIGVQMAEQPIGLHEALDSGQWLCIVAGPIWRGLGRTRLHAVLPSTVLETIEEAAPFRRDIVGRLAKGLIELVDVLGVGAVES